MKHYLFPLLLVTAIATSAVAHAQTDNDQIQHAKNAISATGNCDDALRFLDKISTEGKMTENYFLYMGKAHDCKADNEQAIYYYKKYLEFEPANDSIKLRVAQLSDQKVQTARVANEERVAKAAYQDASTHGTAHKKKHKQRMSIDDNYGLFGIAYGVGLGGANAPYKSSISLNYSGNYPVAHDRIVLNVTIDGAFLFSPNKDWFGTVYNEPSSTVSGVGLGYSDCVYFAPMAVAVNKKKLALTVGPEIGVGYLYTPQTDESLQTSSTIATGAFGLFYGGKANLIVGESLAFSLEYTTSSIKSVDSDSAGFGQTFAMSTSMLKFGIGYRFERWW
jgi:hypothetical protein